MVKVRLLWLYDTELGWRAAQKHVTPLDSELTLYSHIVMLDMTRCILVYHSLPL